MTHSNWIFLCVGCLFGARPPRCFSFAVGILNTSTILSTGLKPSCIALQICSVLEVGDKVTFDWECFVLIPEHLFKKRESIGFFFFFFNLGSCRLSALLIVYQNDGNSLGNRSLDG